MTPMTRPELIALAKEAAAGAAIPMARLKDMAKRAGFTGRPGGWIYHPTATRAICQGWAALADRVALGGEVASWLLAAVENPTQAKCPNDWHRTARARMTQECPECATPAPAEEEPTAKEALAAIGGCWAGGALTGKALKAYEDGDYVLALAIAVDQKALQEKGGQDALHPEHRTRVVQAETLAEVAQEVLDLVEEGQTPELAQEDALVYAMAVPTIHPDRQDFPVELAAGVKVAPMGTPEPGPEDLADLALALAAEDLEHPDPEEEVAPAQPRCVPGDVVTIHRGTRLYEVLQVAPDSAWDRIRGERVDHTLARVAPCDPEDHRDPQWVHVDLLHVQGPVARLRTVDSRYDRRVRYTMEVVKTPDGALRRPALMVTDPQRQPSAHLMPVDSNWDVARPITLRHGDALVLDGRCFRYVEGALEPARWRDRLPVS